MVYGKPLGNIVSRYSAREYDNGGNAITYAKAEITIPFITFDSPRHAKIGVYLHGWTAGQATYYANSDTTITCKASDNTEKYLTVRHNSEDDVEKYVILDANFEGQTGNPVITNICVFAAQNAGGPFANAAAKMKSRDTIAEPTNFKIKYITSSYVLLSDREFTYATTHVCLPETPVKGQFHYIKNFQEQIAFIHAFGVSIDSNPAYYYSGTFSGMNSSNGYDSYTVFENGFVMDSLHACLLVYDGVRWIIQEYFDGRQQLSTYNLIPVPTVTPVLIDKPCVICDIGMNITKYLQLPAIDGPLQVIRVICMSSSQNNFGKVILMPAASPSSFPYPTSIEAVTKALEFRPANNVMNACVTLVAGDGGWWVLNVYEGTTIVHATDITSRTIPMMPITVLQSASQNGIQLTDIETEGDAHEFFIKKLGTNSSNTGIIANTTSTSIQIGSSTFNSVFSNLWKTDTAITLYGIRNGSTTRYYVVSYCSGTY